ncbi:MAG: tetratricopeptide repeat protein [Candidatus Polarisedimenticolia bacterium]
MTKRLPALALLAATLGILGGAAALWWVRLQPDPIQILTPPPTASVEAGVTRQDRRDRQVALARTLVQENDYRGAVAALDRALEAMPGDAEALALQVRALRAQRRYTAARGAALRIQDAYPDSALAHILLGSIATQQGDAATARRDIERAVEIDPSSAQALAQLAALDLMEGKIGEARWRAARSLAMEPDNPTGLRVMAKLVRGRPELLSIMRRLLEAVPDDQLTRAWMEVLSASTAPEVNFIAPILGQVEVPLEPDPDGRFYVRADVGTLTHLRLLVDTGASGMVLAEAAARRLGMKLLEFSESAGLGGLTRHSHPILIHRLAVGPMRAREVMATASNLPQPIDGIINPLIFAPPGSGIMMELQPVRQRLIFRTASGAGTADGRWVSVPYLADGYHIIFRIILAGEPSMALLDTGAAVELIDRSVMRRLPGAVVLSSHDAGTTLLGFGGQIDDAETIEQVPLRIAGRDMTTRRLFLVDLNEESFRFMVDLDAIVGIDRLKLFDLRVDPGAGRLFFRPLP